MTAAQDRGRATENMVAKYLVANGWTHAERRVKHGRKDKGDITGIPGVVIEVKGARERRLVAWFSETVVEARHADVEFYMLVVRVDHKSVTRWDVYIPTHLVIPGMEPNVREEWGWVRMEFELAVKVMRHLGY